MSTLDDSNNMYLDLYFLPFVSKQQLYDIPGIEIIVICRQACEDFNRYVRKGSSRLKKMLGKEIGKWLAEDTTALWRRYSTS